MRRRRRNEKPLVTQRDECVCKKALEAQLSPSGGEQHLGFLRTLQVIVGRIADTTTRRKNLEWEGCVAQRPSARPMRRSRWMIQKKRKLWLRRLQTAEPPAPSSPNLQANMWRGERMGDMPYLKPWLPHHFTSDPRETGIPASLGPSNCMCPRAKLKVESCCRGHW